MSLIAWYKSYAAQDGYPIRADYSQGSVQYNIVSTTNPSAGSSSKYVSSYGFGNAGSSTQYVANSPSLTFLNNSSFTVSLWMRTSVSGLSDPQLFRFGTLPSVVLNFDGAIKIIYDGDGSTTPQSFNATTENLFDGAWHHVLVMYDGSKFSAYVDGAYDGDVTTPNFPLLSSFAMGGTNPDTGDFFTGEIDDIRVYDEALSPEEVAELYRMRLLHLGFDDPSEEATYNYLWENSSFEDLPDLSQWTISNGSTGSFSRSSLAAFDAGFSARIDVSNGGDQYMYRGLNFGGLINGRTFTFSAWVRAFGTNTRLRVASYWMDSGGSFIFSNNVFSAQDARGTTDGWVRVQATGTAPANATTPVMLIAPEDKDGTGYFLVDCVQIEEGPMATPYSPFFSRSTGISDSSEFAHSAGAPSSPRFQYDNPFTASFVKRGGGSAFFDGVDDYIDVASLSNTTFNSGMSFSVWARPTSSANWARFIDFGNGAPSDNILFTREGTSSTLGLHIYSTSNTTLSAANAIENNVWQHLAFTISATGAAKIYKNGSVIASGTLSIPSDTPRANMYIGRSNFSADAYYAGNMDDLRVYGSALSDADIQRIYRVSGHADSGGNLVAKEFSQETGSFSNLLVNNNLIYNGSAQIGSNANFPWATYSTNPGHSFDGDGKGFRRAGNTGDFSTEFIKVNRYDTYRLDGAFRSIGAGGNSNLYYGIACYDKNKQFITHDMSFNFSNTRTQLAAPLKNGDTVVFLNTVANWVVGTAGATEFNKRIAIYNNPDYPGYTYTRLSVQYVTVNSGNNSITLASPWSGGYIIEGTRAANSSDGSTFNYLYIQTIPSTWTHLTGATITGYSTGGAGNNFRYGTEYVTILFLLNFGQGGTFETAFDALGLYNTTTYQGQSSPVYRQGLASDGTFNTLEISEVGVVDGMTSYYRFENKIPAVNATSVFNQDSSTGTRYALSTLGTSTVICAGVRGEGRRFLDTSVSDPTFSSRLSSSALTGITAATVNFSVGAWIKTRTGYVGGAANRSIIQSSTDTSMALFIAQNGRITFRIPTNSSTIEAFGVSQLQAETWYHVMGTYEDGTARVYLNGEMVGSSFTGTGTRDALPTVNMYIGNNNARTNQFVGDIDEVRVYNRALSAREVGVLHASTAPATSATAKTMIGETGVYVAGEIIER